MKGGWVKTKGLYEIFIFFESIVKDAQENPRHLAENPLENPGKEFHFNVRHPVNGNRYFSFGLVPIDLLVGDGPLRWGEGVRYHSVPLL